MSKATKLRRKAQSRKDNRVISDLIKDKLTLNPQSVKNVQETTLSNGQKGVTISFDIFS